MCGFRSLNNSTSKRVLDLLEPVKLTVWKVMIERITVVKFRLDNGGGNGAGCLASRYGRIQRSSRIATFRKCKDLVSELKVFVKDASRVGCSERGVVYFRSCLSPVKEEIQFY